MNPSSSRPSLSPKEVFPIAQLLTFLLDDTQIEQPDTPAPVFAVRALKTALFGTPAPRERTLTKEKAQQQSGNLMNAQGGASPTKLPGILLTPGTATTRRKRVSFGHGVKEGAAEAKPPTGGVSDESPDEFPSPRKDGNTGGGNTISRPKTRLTQAMENARKNRGQRTQGAEGDANEGDDWEEVDEESDVDTDVTVDLNEPHSRSGRYWKSEFETYHADAKAEMEKLVKYKQLAKSYAKKKDEEALELNERLKQEQQRVKQMEKRVSEMGREVALRAEKTGGESDARLLDELSRQTALALEYKTQVDDLENMLLEGAEAGQEDKAPRQRRIASPRTQKTLLETQRELRKARSQAKELDKLRDERDRLRSELKFTEQRCAKLVDENKKLSGYLEESSSRIQDLEKNLKDSRAEISEKDGELKRLRADYGKLKEDAKARYTEAHQVLQKKNHMISELQEEVALLRAEAVGSSLSTRAKNLDAKLKTGSEKIQGSDRDSALKFLEPAKESTELLRDLDELKKVSVQRGIIRPAKSITSKSKARGSTESRKSGIYQDEALTSSRALREKLEADLGKRDSWALSERGNLQDSRSSASSGRSAHSREQEPSRPTRQTERASWPAALAAGATASRPNTKPAIDDIVGDFRAGQKRRKSSSIEQAPRRPFSTVSPSLESEPLQIDLIQDNFAPLGAPVDIHSSAVWDMNASKTRLPADRKAAAIARLERKKMERGRGDRVKENVPY